MNLSARAHFLPGATLSCVLLLAAGCNKSDVTYYQIQKEVAAAPAPQSSVGDRGPATPAAPAAPNGGMANTAMATAAGPGLAWTAPATWQPKPLGAMRKGSFTVPAGDGVTADLS